MVRVLMGRSVALRLAFVFWMLLAFSPVLAMLQRSLVSEGHLSLAAYAQLLTSTREWDLLGATILLAAGTALGAGLIGVPLAVLLTRSDLPGRRFLFLLFLLPVLLPPSVLAYGWFTMLGRGGYLGGVLGSFGAKLLFGPAGCLLVLVASFTPVVLLVASAALASVNPRLEEAARLSATTPRVLAGITLPQVLPGCITAMLVVFCLALGETGAPIFLRVNVYAVESLAQFAAFHDFSAATAAAAPLLVMVVAVFWLLHFVGARPGAAMLAPAAEKPSTPFRLGRPRASVVVLLSAVWAVLAGLPLAALATRSADASAYVAALTSGGASFGRSLAFAALGASVILFFGVLIAVGRTTGALGPAAEALTLFLFALPGPVLGIGLISLWNRPATNAIFGTPAIIILGFVAQYIILGVWATKAGLALIPRSMDEAAAVAGAGWISRLTRITAPQAWKALVAAWLLAFLLCFRDTGIAMVVYPPGGDTFTVRLFTMMANGRPEVIAAMCVLMLVSVTAPFAALGALYSRSPS